MEKTIPETEFTSLLPQGNVGQFEIEIALVAHIIRFLTGRDAFEELRQLFAEECPKKNLSWHDLVEVLEQIGFEPTGFEIGVEDIHEFSIATPLLSLYYFPERGYVNIIIYKITEEAIFAIHDGSGAFKIPLEELDYRWQGHLLMIEPTEAAFQTETFRQAEEALTYINKPYENNEAEIEKVLAKWTIPKSDFLDIVIIGAGVGGVLSGVYAARENLNFVILEKSETLSTFKRFPKDMHFVSGGLSKQLSKKHVPPSAKSLPDAYIQFFENVAAEEELYIRENEAVISIRKEDNIWITKTNISTYYSRAVINAGGFYGNFNRLNIPVSEDAEVLYGFSDCYKNAESFIGKKVLVVGTGVSALNLCHHFSKKGIEVSLFSRDYIHVPENMFEHLKAGNNFDTDIITDVYAKISVGLIDLIHYGELKAVRKGEVDIFLEQEDGLRTFTFDVVCPMIGFSPIMDHLKESGLSLAEGCKIPKYDTRTMETDQKNLFLCGSSSGVTNMEYILKESKGIISVIKERFYGS